MEIQSVKSFLTFLKGGKGTFVFSWTDDDGSVYSTEKKINVS